MSRLALAGLAALSLLACTDSIVDPTPAAPALHRVGSGARLVSSAGYDVTILPDLVPGAMSSVMDVDSHGHAVGYAADGVHYYPVWWHDGTVEQLAIPTVDGYAMSLNDAHQIVINYYESFAPRAGVWQNGVLTDLGDRNGDAAGGAQGYAINSSGQVAGQQSSNGGAWDPVRWSGASTLVLPVPPGYAISSGFGINDAGLVVGYTSAGISTFTGAVWDGGQIITPIAGAIFGVNRFGEYAGTCGNGCPLPTIKAFRGRGNDVTFLDDLGNGAVANDINDAGIVVGTPYGGGGVFWTGTTMHELGVPAGYGSGAARAISNTNIAGGAIDGHGALWYLPSPETAATIAEDIVQKVQQLAVAERAKQPLLVKVRNAARNAQAGSKDAAIGEMGAFKNQLGAYVKRGDVSAATAAPLFERADAFIAKLR